MLISLFIFLAFCVLQHFWCSQSFFDFKNCASYILEASHGRIIFKPQCSKQTNHRSPEVWNASISSQNNPQSCHPYELMSPWGFTFRQNISEMEVDIYAKILFRQDSFQIRALMTTDTSETSSVDKKFPELLKVSRGFRPILRPWPFLQTILIFSFRILASQYIWLWTEKYHKEGVNVSFWQFYSGFCAPSAFIYPQGWKS